MHFGSAVGFPLTPSPKRGTLKKGRPPIFVKLICSFAVVEVAIPVVVKPSNPCAFSGGRLVGSLSIYHSPLMSLNAWFAHLTS